MFMVSAFEYSEAIFTCQTLVWPFFGLEGKFEMIRLTYFGMVSMPRKYKLTSS